MPGAGPPPPRGSADRHRRRRLFVRHIRTAWPEARRRRRGRKCRAPRHAAARPARISRLRSLLQQALVLQVAQQILQPDAAVALQRECLGDVALARAVGVFGDELQDVFPRRAEVAFRRPLRAGGFAGRSCFRKCCRAKVLGLFLRPASCRRLLAAGFCLASAPCGTTSCRCRPWPPSRRSSRPPRRASPTPGPCPWAASH